MNLSHEEYLKKTLDSKKIEMENLKISHRIALAEYEVKKEMLYGQIYSIENQLDSK